MAYLLDTNVLSELRKAGKSHPKVRHWEASVSVESCFVSVLSFTEIKRGILQVRKKDSQFGDLLEDWYEQQLQPTFAQRILPVDFRVAEKAAEFMAIRTRGLADALIAATAFTHGLDLVTRNEQDFDDVGVTVLNPWNSDSKATD